MIFDRRTFLSVAGAGVLSAALPAPALAQGVISLPDDIVRQEAATITAVSNGLPMVAMTFDDGPHPTLTPRLLDILRARNIKATFYLIGNRVAQWPDLTRRIAAEGHEIGNHSWSHPYLSRRTTANVISEIDATSEVIYRATGRPPVTFRPPYGAFTRAQRQMLHENRRMPTILWSVDPQDWRRPGASVVANRILSRSRAGAIILSHDIHSGTIAAMPSTLDGLRARGLQFGTVSQMIGWPLWQTRHFRRVAQSS
ncbi:polysaccharide deacetylase family protein [Roseisalinus antarcticus]|uniref:Chitooligosaccharide deacetylase n=1 Tax=Roseisalinus antarcticus TaxID=254357 RepID=A0A1Y5RI49_9RHOB|nr:polysaccharide deacetylase family protein [Roseisalinus antarcticus]SLN17721.1 Peptidoglycan-N-acetylglucosamine deacetylase [Roseisalinus antarcticus]